MDKSIQINDTFANQKNNAINSSCTIVNLVKKLTLCITEEEVERLLSRLTNLKQTVIVSFVNAHAINLCFENPSFIAALHASDYVLRDGIGMEILLTKLNLNPGVNLVGTDLIPQIMFRCKDKPIALFGTQEPFLTKAKQYLTKHGFNVVSTVHGFHAVDRYLTKAQATPAEVIVMGMGMPKQELIAQYLKQHLPYNAIIINGGGMIDLWGEKVKRAPMLVRKFKLEWLFRLLLEPRRLFLRYILGNFIFLKRVVSITHGKS